SAIAAARRSRKRPIGSSSMGATIARHLPRNPPRYVRSCLGREARYSFCVMRTFTLDEANRLVPRIASALARTTQLLGHARLIARQLAEEGVSGDEPGGPPDEAGVDDPELAFEIARARLLITAAKEE